MSLDDWHEAIRGHPITKMLEENRMSETELKVGRYYWVLVQSSKKEPEWQPARFTGVSGDSAGGTTWDFIGFNSDSGHHFVEVKQVGGQIDVAATMFKVTEALRTDDEAAP